MVTVDGIVQPHNAAVYMSADFNEGSGATNQIIDLGSYVGVNDQASKIEIRDIWWLTLDDDTRLLTSTAQRQDSWEHRAGLGLQMETNNQFDTGSSGFTRRWLGLVMMLEVYTGNVGNIVMGAAG